MGAPFTNVPLRLLASRTVAMMTTNRLDDHPDLPEPIRRTQPWGLGWRMNHFATDAETRRRLDELFAQSGPALLDVHLEDEPCPAAPPGPWSQVEERAFFMRALQSLDGAK